MSFCIARIAKAHSMHVLGIRRNPQKDFEYIDEMGSRDDLNRFIPQADYIVAVLPRTPETEHFLDEEHFQMMKPDVIIVNAGRGCHIDETVLIKALHSKQIRGAGLDTFETEPLPEKSLFWGMDNVIISPHCAGGSKNYNQKAINIFIDNLRRFINNEPLQNVVDKYLAY